MEETVIWEGSPSNLKIIGIFILDAVLSIAIIAAAILLVQPLLFGLLILPAGYMAWKMIQLKSSHYEITNERIRYTSGIFSKQTEDMELYRIKDYKLVQPFSLRLFGLSDILVSTSDKSTPDLTIQAVHNGRELLDKLRLAVEKRRDMKRVRAIDMDMENI